MDRNRSLANHYANYIVTCVLLTWFTGNAIIFKSLLVICWAEAPIKIARMTLTIKLDGNWSSFQLANSAPPLSVTDSAIAPSARICESCDYENETNIVTNKSCLQGTSTAKLQNTQLS